MSIVDRAFLKEVKPDAEIKTLSYPIFVKGLGTRRHPTVEFVLLKLYLDGIADGHAKIAYIKREFHIVEELSPKLLVGIDIIGPKQINFDAVNKRLILMSHDSLTIPVDMDPSDFKTKVKTQKKVVIKLNTSAMIGIKLDKPLKENRDYLFTLEYTSTTKLIEKAGGFYNAITDIDFDRVQIRNDLDKDLVIPRHAFIGHLESFGGEAYLVRLDGVAKHLAVQSTIDAAPPTNTHLLNTT